MSPVILPVLAGLVGWTAITFVVLLIAIVFD
jgi:hypothetical protein